MGPHGPIWAHMVPYGPVWARMGPSRAHVVCETISDINILKEKHDTLSKDLSSWRGHTAAEGGNEAMMMAKVRVGVRSGLGPIWAHVGPYVFC